MNDLTSTQLVKKEIGFRDMLTSPSIMDQFMKLAEIMAKSKDMVPKHFNGNTGGCFAVIMQAAQWSMNPFSVAQKTYIVNGNLGYEAQLVNAVVSSSKAISGRFKYQYKGDWLKHNVPGSDAAVRVGATLLGGSDITWGEWLFVADVTVKNSPLWKTMPKQQGGYLAVKYWSRLYCPEVILGVYTPDEIIHNIAEKVLPNDQAAQASALLDGGAEEGSNIVKIADVLNMISSANDKDQLKCVVNIAKCLADDEKIVAKNAYKEKLKQIAILDKKVPVVDEKVPVVDEKVPVVDEKVPVVDETIIRLT